MSAISMSIQRMPAARMAPIEAPRILAAVSFTSPRCPPNKLKVTKTREIAAAMKAMPNTIPAMLFRVLRIRCLSAINSVRLFLTNPFPRVPAFVVEGHGKRLGIVPEGVHSI